FNTAMMLVFTFTRMFGLSPRLSLLTLVLVPLTTVTFFLILRVVHRRYERVQRQFANISAMSQENFAGIRVVKGFGIENREVGKFGALNDEFINRNMSLVRVEGPLWPLMEVLFGLTTSVILLIGGRQVLGAGGSLSIGEFSSFLLLFEALSWPIIALGRSANVFQPGVTSWGRARARLARRPLARGVQWCPAAVGGAQLAENRRGLGRGCLRARCHLLGPPPGGAGAPAAGEGHRPDRLRPAEGPRRQRIPQRDPGVRQPQGARR